MVDDDVELSSELLDQVGNDDIDIDIDLLTAQQDEDFILEDAESEKDTEDAIAVNDDIMQDEENASYQMDDVDIMQEEHVENLQMEDAYQSRVLGADFASTKMSHNRSDIPEEYTEDINGASEAAMDDLTDHATFLGDSEVKQGLEVQGLSDTDFVKSREAENFELPPQLSTSEENLASEGQPRGRNSPASPGTTSPKSARPGTQDQTGHETISELVDQVAQDHNSADSVADKGKHAPQPKIIVVWRDAEYDLIAVSDTDDPDSFFLTDTKLIKEPFPSFIAALRDVVLDELNPEEELCLVIEDLGLEVTEVSSTAHDMSLEDILDLYGKLLRNDGVEMPGPLYITLGTKPHFARRLANLFAGAADGKGLSELVSWEEGSQELGTDDLSVEPESSDQQVTDHDNNLEVVDEFTHQENDESGPEIPAEEDAQDDLAQETLVVTDSIKSAEQHDQPGNDKNTSGQTTPPLSIPPNEQGDLGGRGQPAHSAGAELADYPKGDVDEDGDLIDYSDDELLPNEELDTVPDTLSQANEDSTQDVNENPQQLSLSLAAEEDRPHVLPQEQTDDFGNEQNNTYLEPEPGSYGSDAGSDNGVGYVVEEDFAAQVWDDEDEYDNEPKDGEESLDADEQQAISEDVAYDDEITEDNSAAISALKIMPNQNHPLEENGVDAEDHDGIDQSIRNKGSATSTLFDDTTASDSNNLTFKNDATKEAYIDPDEINYEEVEGQNSNNSERTPLADETARNAQGGGHEEFLYDEINYEEDDHQDLSISSEPKFTNDTSPTADGRSGKRPWSDAEGATDGDSKYSKRLRS